MPTSSTAPELSPDYRPEGDFQALKGLVNLDAIRTNTEWPPPLPKALRTPIEIYDRGKPETYARGWIAPDPMPIVSFQSDTDTDTDTDTDAAAEPSKDLLEIDARKYGFRFHFNPTAFTEAYSNTEATDPIRTLRALSMAQRPLLAKETGASFDLDLLLTRQYDMRILRTNNWRDAYVGITEKQREAILTRGTMADIEYIFRLINGKTFPTWWDVLGDGSGDWGMFLPRPVIVSLGDGPTSHRLRGFFSSMSITHTIFAPGMIPILSRVNVKIERLLDSMHRPVDWDDPNSSATSVRNTATSLSASTSARPSTSGGYPNTGSTSVSRSSVTLAGSTIGGR